MKVRDIMKPVRWVIGRDETLATAARTMARHHRRHTFVVDAGKLVGSIAESDILAYRARAPSDIEWWAAPVVAAMQELSAVASPDDPVAVAVERLGRSRTESLPVAENGHLVGQVSARELLELDLSARRPAELVTAADIMTDPAVAITPDDSLLVAAALMAEHQLRHLPVIEGGIVIGIVSDRDIRTAIGDPVRFVGSPAPILRVTVRDAMTGSAITVAPSTPVIALAATFADEKIGAVPVVDRERKLLGVVSYVDVLRALAVRR